MAHSTKRATLIVLTAGLIAGCGGGSGSSSDSGTERTPPVALTACSNNSSPITLSGDLKLPLGLRISDINFIGYSGLTDVSLTGLDTTGSVIVSGHQIATVDDSSSQDLVVLDNSGQGYQSADGISLSLEPDMSGIQAHLSNETCGTDGTYYYIEAHGTPAYSTDTFPNSEDPYAVVDQSRVLRIPVSPSVLSTPIPLSADRFDAVLINSVPVMMRSPDCLGSTLCGQVDSPNPMQNPSWYGMDSHNGHVLADGSYHYHGDPKTLYDTGGTIASGVIGLAADGFPIYGPWIDDGGVIRKVTSSYQLKTGARPDPLSSEYYNGDFTGDYEYVDSSGDLDECNGMTVDGHYGYYVTDTFPYMINCFRGQPDLSFNR